MFPSSYTPKFSIRCSTLEPTLHTLYTAHNAVLTVPTAPTAVPVSGAVGGLLAPLVGVYRPTLAPLLLAPPPQIRRRANRVLPDGLGRSSVGGNASQSQAGREKLWWW